MLSWGSFRSSWWGCSPVHSSWIPGTLKLDSILSLFKCAVASYSFLSSFSSYLHKKPISLRQIGGKQRDAGISNHDLMLCIRVPHLFQILTDIDIFAHRFREIKDFLSNWGTICSLLQWFRPTLCIFPIRNCAISQPAQVLVAGVVAGKLSQWLKRSTRS